MHKSIARIIGGAIFVTLLCSGVAFAADLSASDAQKVVLKTDQIVFIEVGDSVEFNLKMPTSFGGGLDGTWPLYFWPTYPGHGDGTPTCSLAFWTNCQYGATVRVQPDIEVFDEGSGGTISLSQLFYAPRADNPQLSADGDDPDAPWRPFSDECQYTDVAESDGPGPVRADQDYEFQWQADDQAFDGSAVPTLTYTVTANNQP